MSAFKYGEMIEQTKLIRFELTKVRRNDERSYGTHSLQMHHSSDKHMPTYQRTETSWGHAEANKIRNY